MNKVSGKNAGMLRSPTVSIGVPVYNGEKTLSEALDSLIEQTFKDFEVIICDNASTDNTATIAKEYAQRDSRFKYYRSEINKGAAHNFNWAFKLSSGEYFKWHAADDIILPEYLEDCIAPLRMRSDVVLSFSMRKIITNEGRTVRGEPGLIRYRQLPENDLDNISLTNVLRLSLYRVPLLVFGLIRSSVLAKTGLIGKFIASDHCLVYELRLHGRFVQIPKPLYIQRLHPRTPSYSQRKTRKGETFWFGTTSPLAVNNPELKLFKEMIKAYKRAYNRRSSMEHGIKKKYINTVLEIMSFRAHIEIRFVRALIIPFRRLRWRLFDRWSKISESFLRPDAPNYFALYIWYISAAVIKGQLEKIFNLLRSKNSTYLLLTESLEKVMYRDSKNSISLLCNWLMCTDNEKVRIVAMVYKRASIETKKNFLFHLKQMNSLDVFSKIGSFTNNL